MSNSESSAEGVPVVAVSSGWDVDAIEIHHSYGDVAVLRGVDLHVPAGTTTCLIGASGSGKSTFLRCVNGLERPSAGRVLVDGRSLDEDGTDPNRWRADIGMVFQHFHLFGHLSVMANIMLALRKVRRMSKADAEQVARQQLAAVGLGQFADKRPAQLSGGQQQRVAIARALAMEPKVMLFDEATSALDPELVKGVLSIMRDLSVSGMTMLVVTHEMRFAREVASQVAFLESGKVGEVGTAEQIFHDPQTDGLRAFLSQVL